MKKVKDSHLRVTKAFAELVGEPDGIDESYRCLVGLVSSMLVMCKDESIDAFLKALMKDAVGVHRLYNENKKMPDNVVPINGPKTLQ